MNALSLLRRWGPLALVVLIGVAVYAAGLNHYVSLSFLRARHDALKAYVDAHFWLSLLAFTVFFTLLTSVAVPGAVFAQVAGGLMFGTWIGGFSIAFAATIGALVWYYVARSAFGETIRKRLEARPGVLGRLHAGLQKNSFWFLLGVRLAPVVPFVLVNIASGLAGIPLRRYVPATFLGTAPTNLVYAAIGAGLGRSFSLGRDPGAGLWADPRVWLPLTALAVLSLVPILIRWSWARWGARLTG